MSEIVFGSSRWLGIVNLLSDLDDALLHAGTGYLAVVASASLFIMKADFEPSKRNHSQLALRGLPRGIENRGDQWFQTTDGIAGGPE